MIHIIQNDPEVPPGNLSDSDFSDLELEDIAAVKLRARTPPWQKVEQSQWCGGWGAVGRRLDGGWGDGWGAVGAVR